mmetsp:Transcript_9412/g.19560  ORF Transcript_9412/g.19560 Transcript_9412/m.19560 type:complete len:95 (-) Transcript_9412:134-418(-)
MATHQLPTSDAYTQSLELGFGLFISTGASRFTTVRLRLSTTRSSTAPLKRRTWAASSVPFTSRKGRNNNRRSASEAAPLPGLAKHRMKRRLWSQ